MLSPLQVRTAGLLLVCATAVACCDCHGNDDTVPPGPEEESCAGTFGVPAWDALLESPTIDGVAALYHVGDAAALLEPEVQSRLLADLEAARRAEAGSVPVASRVALQNDLWGLHQRLSQLDQSNAHLTALLDATSALLHVLAPRAQELSELGDATRPTSIADVLPIHDGWREMDTEHSVLGHERIFGIRRLFRIYVKPGHRALVSQLVAIDAQGAAHLTPIVGEVEHLEIDDERLRSARVFHLDRRALRCDPDHALHETRTVAHIPTIGANGYLIRFDPPSDLDTLPCAECHDDNAPFSLPSDATDPAERHARLLEQARATYPTRQP